MVYIFYDIKASTWFAFDHDFLIAFIDLRDHLEGKLVLFFIFQVL